MTMFELVGNKEDFKEIRYKGKRIGSIWDNPREKSFTVKIDPEFWHSPFEISESQSHHTQKAYCVIVSTK